MSASSPFAGSVWRQLAADLDRRGDGSRALVEPGQLFAFQRWGGTIDHVLPAVTDHSVVTRYIVPFADLRAADLQWGVDDLIGQERAVPDQLRRMLDLMAVGDLIVASDTDRRRGGGQGPIEATQRRCSRSFQHSGQRLRNAAQGAPGARPHRHA